MDVTHLYSKGIHSQPRLFSKLPADPNSFLLFVRVISKHQAPLIVGRDSVKTLVETSRSPLQLAGIRRGRGIGNRPGFWFEEDFLCDPVDIKGRVSHVVLEKPVDFECSYIEAFIDEVFRVTTTLGGEDPD